MEKILGQPKFLKEINVGIIEDIIIHFGPISKPEVARKSGLSLPTVNKIVSNLETAKKIKIAGTESGNIGRKAQLYVINEDYGNILAVHLQKESLKCSVINMVGEIIYRFTLPIDTSVGEEALQGVFIAIDRLKENAKAEIMAIGVAIPAVLNKDKTISRMSLIPQWERMNLEAAIEEHYNIKTYVENDVKLATIGYYQHRLAETADSIVYLSLDTSIGCGVVVNQRLYRGMNDFAGSAGFMIVNDGEGEEEEPHSNCLGRQMEALLSKMEGGKNAAEIVKLREQAAKLVGRALVNFISIMNPQVVVLRGKIVSDSFLCEIKSYIGCHIPDSSIPEIIEDNTFPSVGKGVVVMCRPSTQLANFI